MFTFEEKKDYFIRECKNKRYLMKKLAEINDELNRVNSLMKSGYRSETDIHLEEEAVIIKERDNLTERINYIDDVIARIRDPQGRGIITDLWINGHSKAKVSRIQYTSEGQLYKKVKKELKNVL